MKRKICLGFILVFSLILTGFSGPTFAKGKDWKNHWKKGRVVRDEYGIPHIYAHTNRDLFELFGYTVAVDRLWHLEYNTRAARGSLAEILGPAYLSSDIYRRLVSYTEDEYMALLRSLRPETQEVLQAYADGVNRRIAEVLASPDELLPYEFKELGIQPSLFLPTHPLACSSSSLRTFGTIGGSELTKARELEKLIAKYGEDIGWKMFNDLYWVNDPDAPTYIEKEGEIGRPGRFHRAAAAASHVRKLKNLDKASKEYDHLLATLEKLNLPVSVESASFAWAVSAARTATRYPMLAGNPQMGFAYPGIVYEVHLKGGNGFDVAGYNGVGRVSVAIGHNRDLAWSLMVGMGDNVDLYQETLNPANREQYWYKNAWVDMEKRVETFNVAGGSPVTMTIYRTIHGPVIDPNPFDPSNTAVDQVYTWKYAHWLIEPQTVEAYLTMMRARDPEEFEESLKQYRSSLHCIYADRRGNIAYWQGGLVPIRPEGADFRLPLLGDGTQEWTGEYRVTPKALNPEKGFIAGWNNKSSPEFNNPDSSAFGKYNRALWLERTLKERKGITLEDMKDIQRMMGSVGWSSISPLGTDGVGIYKEDILPYLKWAIGIVPPDDPYYSKLNEALAVLVDWDGLAMDDVVASTHIKAAQVIFDNWVTLMLQKTFGDEFQGIVSFSRFSHSKFSMLIHALEVPFSPLNPSRDYFDDVTTPETETWYQLMVRSMKETIDNLEAEFGTVDMSQWTPERAQTSVRHPIIGTIKYFPTQNSGTYCYIAQAKPSGIESMSRWPYGINAFIGMDSAGNPVLDGPHLFDMLELYVNYEYQPIFQ